MIWAFYLFASIIAIRWNPHLGIAFSLHLLAMQGVKAMDFANYQIIFFAVHSASALLIAIFLDKTAGGVLALIAGIYGMHVFGLIGQTPKLVISESLFILGLIVGSINGSSGTVLGVGDNLALDRFVRNLANVSPFIQKSEKVRQKD